MKLVMQSIPKVVPITHLPYNHAFSDAQFPSTDSNRFVRLEPCINLLEETSNQYSFALNVNGRISMFHNNTNVYDYGQVVSMEF